nr:hypothetical protein [Tanacetum cinerariifolium]
VSIAVSEVVTDAVDLAMQAPLRNRFRDLPEELTHDLAEAQKKRKKGRESPKMPPGSPSHQPPPPPPPAGPSGTSGAPRASGSEVTPPPPPPTSTNQDSPSTGSAAPSPTKTAATTKHQAWSTPDRGRPHTEAQRQQITTTGGPPGQVTIQSDFFFNKDLEYLIYGSKGRRPALSISKMKAAYYSDAGLEQMVPDQFWIEEECKYDIGHEEHKHESEKWESSSNMAIYTFKWFKNSSFSAGDHGMRRHGIELLDGGVSGGGVLVGGRVVGWAVIGLFDSSMCWPNGSVVATLVIVCIGGKRKFDGTLQQIVEALDYRVKEFRINRMNPEAFEDTENLPQPGELCWRTRQRGRLQTFEAEDGNSARANIKQALGRNPDGCSCWPKGHQFTTPCPLFKLIIDDSKNTYNTTSTTLMYVVMIKDRVLSTCMAFGENTRDLSSFKEETNKITDLHQIYAEVLFTERGDGVTGIKRRRRDLSSDGVRDLATTLGRSRLKEDQSST